MNDPTRVAVATVFALSTLTAFASVVPATDGAGNPEQVLDPPHGRNPAVFGVDEVHALPPVPGHSGGSGKVSIAGEPTHGVPVLTLFGAADRGGRFVGNPDDPYHGRSSTGVSPGAALPAELAGCGRLP